METKILRKQKYNYGVNTTFDNGIVLSSCRMLNGTTTYNIYDGYGIVVNSRLLIEDDNRGYNELVKIIDTFKSGTDIIDGYGTIWIRDGKDVWIKGGKNEN